MSAKNIQTEIRDANLSYLMLAQQMIRSDKAAAIFRLGINESVANNLEHLSNSQVINLSSGASMLMRFRFDNAAVLSMLTNEKKELANSRAHTAILLAGQAMPEAVRHDGSASPVKL